MRASVFVAAVGVVLLCTTVHGEFVHDEVTRRVDLRTHIVVVSTDVTATAQAATHLYKVHVDTDDGLAHTQAESADGATLPVSDVHTDGKRRWCVLRCAGQLSWACSDERACVQAGSRSRGRPSWTDDSLDAEAALHWQASATPRVHFAGRAAASCVQRQRSVGIAV